MTPTLILRPLKPEEWGAVAALIFESTNAWYEANRGMKIFQGSSADCLLFPEVYEALDPGCCVVAEDPESGRLMGSCFYHPRETHVSLGIMNVSGDFFGRGVARKLLEFVIAFSEQEQKSVRLVSSAMNLDSFSLYTKAGFVPQTLFQDMFLAVPEGGLPPLTPGVERVRPAQAEDAERMADLEFSRCGIRRQKDFAHFIANDAGIWHVSVLEGEDEELSGFLCSVKDPASHMLGPGFATTELGALALIHEELNQYPGDSPVFLVPTTAKDLVGTLYRWGAKNCELHVSQVLGESRSPEGIVMPTFMPETA